MLGRTSPTEFAALPLEAQLERLKAALSVEDPRELLRLCASLRDLAPLGFLSERLWQEGFFADAAQREFFARFLVAQPEMTVHRLLRALVGQIAGQAAVQPAGPPSAAGPGRDRSPTHLRDTLLRCLQLAPLARLTSMCLIDRALKHHFPTERDQAIEALVARAAELLDRDRIEELSLDELAQLPGRAVPELRTRAAARSAETLARFDARRAELATAAITVLAEIPKAVSQANAEDLLSRRVYTDPGHFLVELLQNAEDAGARTFRVRFERTRLCIWHDGAPFDTRDLVGVTSIGQTTKRKQQIGFFGVGFKSVYEITDRPQVFSDVYQFEIADVSLPRPLAERPRDLGEASDGGTLLVLPLQKPDDRVRSAAALYQKARAIDPCVLFTLRSISALELELAASAGGPLRHAVRETPLGKDGRAAIRQEPDGWERSYLLQDDEYRYEGGQREAGRPDSTRLLIGVRMTAPTEPGGVAVPQPLPDDAATVYSYLPTAERSGLRFFVQGHFDVPVDRERISGESPWNRWIISKVPVQLSRLLLRAATQGPAVAAGLLDVLPLGREISSPLFRSLPAMLRLALWETPILPGLDGETRAPCETLIAPPQVAALLGAAPLPRALLPPRKRSAEEIDPGPLATELHLLDPGLPERSLEVARSLGCELLDGQRLLGLLTVALGELPAGSKPPPSLAPLVGSPERLERLFDLFLSELEALERRGHSAPARELLGRLRALPLLLDEEGGLHRVDAQGTLPVVRGPEELRAIYRGLRPLLHPELDEALGAGERPSGRTTAMLNRLSVGVLALEGLVRDLEALLGRGGPPQRSAPLLAPYRHERTLELLAAAPLPLQRRAGSLPILPGADGGLHPVARGLDDTTGLCRPAEGPYAEALHAFYAAAPLARPLPPRTPSAAVASLLAELGAPQLGLPLLLADLERDPVRLGAGLVRLRELHRLLEAATEDLPERDRRRLETLPIWPDRRGIGRPLRGKDAVYLPTSDEIAALVPTAPLLDAEVCARRHVRDMRPQPVTAWLLELIEQLARPGQPLAVQPTFLSTLGGVIGMLRALCSEPPPIPPPKLPLADVQQRLHLASLGGPGTLHEADNESRGLVSGLDIERELLHPMLRTSLPPAWSALVPALPLSRLLAALANAPGPPARHPLADPARRAALYRFLSSHEPALFSDAACREVLQRGRLLPSRGGQLLSVEELVLDPELPDLGVDWAPHAEVPAEVLQLLVRHLGAGQRPLLDLVRRHLRPAYVEAARRRDGALAARILGYLAARLGDWQPEALVALLCPAGEPLPIEDEAGSFRALHEVVVPRPEHAAPLRTLFGPRCPLPSARYPAEVSRLLIRLGATELPSLEQLRAVLRPGVALPGVLPSGLPSSEQAQALAALLGALHEVHGPALVRELGLSELPWLLDGTQRPRRPPELYRPSPELELLIGAAPDLYPSPGILGRLPEALLDELALRGPRDVQLPSVLRHLDHCERAQRPVSFRVYQWLEKRLVQGQLDEKLLSRELSGRRWICLDEGRFVAHTQVLGVVALRYFGSRRSSWERGAEECPRLCRLMGIPLSVTPESVAAFLAELGPEVRARGDLALLAAEPALPRMLLACYGLLGRSGQPISRDLPVILCRASVPVDPMQEHPAEQRLLPASAPSLLRSDTPTLERLFQGAGTLHLVAAGPPEERDDIERFHQGQGIRRLRDAYTIAIDGAGGEDRSHAYATQLQRLRGVLRALSSVLPRVRAQRTQLATEGWTFEARLRPLAESGGLLAIEPLRVRYRLDGVGEASEEVAAAYDPARGALLIDTEVLDDPLSHTSGLSQGVLPCVYDGPGEEQLLDIIEILLPLYTAARMNDYLDRRHFPTVGIRRKALERVTDRLLEILDYGLDAKLLARFPELRGARLGSWRGAGVLRAFEELLPSPSPSPSGDERLSEELSVLVARHALLAAGVEAPTSGLVDALADLLRAGSLSEVPARVLQSAQSGTSPLGSEPLEAPPEPLPRVDTRKREAEHMQKELAGLGQAVEREADGPPLRIGLSGLDEPLDIEPTSAIGTALANTLDGSGRPLVERRPPTAVEPGTGPERSAVTPPVPGAPSLQPPLQPSLQPSVPPSQPLPPPPTAAWPSAGDDEGEAPGLFSRMARFFGIGRPPPPAPTVPTPGSLLGGNCMEPAQGIEPQLWATPGALRAVVRQPVLAQLRYTPPKLPAPYLYAVRALGGAFDAETQRWGSPRLDGTDFTKGLRPSGHTVIFEGQVAPGLSVLPRPLYSRLRAAPRLLDGTADQLDLLTLPDGVQGVRVHGERPLRLHYEVELLEVGAVTQFRGNLSAPPQLLAPSLPLSKLPDEVQAFVEERRRLGGPAWEAALAVQGFVQWRYAYDLEFRTRPEVEAQAARLRPGRGNHHYQLLHAGADGTFLGRGTCFELNMLVVELLRHLGVPALLAGGWALDQGWIDRPDHSFGLAVVWSSSGPCLLPVDATKGPQGPRRLLPGIGEPAPLITVDGASAPAQQAGAGGGGVAAGAPLVSAPPVPPVPGPWSADEVLPGPGPADAGEKAGAGRFDEVLAELSAAEARRYLRDSELSLRALLLVCRKTGRAVPDEVTELARQPALPPTERAARLRAALELVLGDTEQAAALLLILRCGEQQVTVLSPALEALAGLGILQVRAVPQFQVSPAPESGSS